MSALPPYVSRDLVEERLPLIFPEGTPNRNYCTRQLAASSVFTGLYIGAVEGTGCYLGPVHVYRMTYEQADKTSDMERVQYPSNAQSRKHRVVGQRWYADNTREPIRDETLRDGLVAIGAVIQRQDLATTSSKPRYALRADFAALFDPRLVDVALNEAIEDFQKRRLSKSALARVRIVRSGAAAGSVGILVKFPNGETRQLAPGPSSVISQGVIEVFAIRFLLEPAVLWLSESGNKVVAKDDKLANEIGLKIEADKNLPDIILCDVGPPDPLLIFVEVVASDGAMTAGRQKAIYGLTDAAGFARKNVVFLTAYHDRSAAAFKKTVAQLAWNTLVWFMSEPEHIVMFRADEPDVRLPSLIGG